ncbi:meiosis-specific protein ASY3 isoform X1 [Daucus carota subsp. sativus]|uniref:meiosis-specific protein ASY3 isoform X1 n=1 Tax=Daucus carota subsp. sativus TaxID=79200 RepID=UPI0007EF051C|nr:PREDICTED: uncharacterized protein LOC108208166 isoform X2 [Daucus carota subsp. sativus]
MSQCRSFGSNYHPSSQSRKVSIGIVVDQFAKKPSDIREYGAVPFTGNLGSSKENTNEETRKNGKGKDAGKEKESEAAVHEASLLVATPTGVFDPKQGQRYNVPNNSPKNTRKFNSSQMSVLKSDDGQQKKFGSVTYGKKGQRDGSSNRVEEVSFAIGQKLKDPVEEVVLEKPVYTEKQGHEALRMKIWEALAAVSTPTKELSNSQTKNNCTDNLEPEQKSDEKKSSAVKPRQNSDTIESDSDGPSHTMKRPVTRSLTRKRPTKVQQHKTTNAPSSSDRHKQIEKTTFFFNEGLSRRTTSATIGGSSGSRGRKKNCSTIEPRKLHFPKSSNASETFHVTDTGYMEDHIDSSSGFKKGTGRHSYQFPFIEKTDKPGGNFESIFPKSVDEQVDGIGPSLRNNGEPHFDFNSPTHRVNTPTETCFGGLSPNNKQGDQEDVYSPMKGIINMENIRSFKSFYASDPNSKKSNEAKEISEDEVEQEDFSSEPQFNFKPPTLGLQPPAESCFGGSSLKTNQGKQEDVNRPTKVVYNMKNIRRFSNFFASKSDSNKENKKTEVSDDEVEHENSPVEPRFDFKSHTLGMNTPTKTCFDGFSPINDQGKQEDVCSPMKGVLQSGKFPRFQNFFASQPESNENKKREISDDEVEQEESPVEKSLPSQKVMNTANILSTPSSEEDGSESSDEGPSEAETPEIATAQQPEILFHPTKRCRLNDGADATVYSPPSSPKVSENFYELPSEMNEEDGLARAVSLFAMVLKRVKSKMKSVANRRSAEILTSVATEMHLQLQNAESQIQTDLWKLSGIGKTKRRRLEIRFQEQQEQLKGIYERFRNEVNMHLQDCRSTFEELESQQTEFRDIVEKQKASHGKLMLEAEQAIKTQLDGAERRITTVHKSARQKMLQLRYVIAECLKEDVLY